MNTQNVNTAASESSERWVEKKAPRFISTPYEKGVSLREDVFKRQFSVRVTGSMEYLEEGLNEPFTCTTTLSVCYASTISDAVRKVTNIQANKSWNIKYQENGPLGFTPRHIEIRDHQNRKVLCGTVNSQIEWIEAVSTAKAVSIIEQKQAELREEARDERAYNNFSTARLLERQATEIGMEVVDKIYRDHPEIRQILDRQVADELYKTYGPEMDMHNAIYEGCES
ncbi:hypothetical protein I2494_17935 [Budviciaceae bacterium BWR-B9]|uniref:Uncharacterized protein n=1 Tax=Limnobaculum allomyrinae TaxID=2791986 RepID=A0ABS1IUX2_9GAMM|nr:MULTISPECIES: hypothetical protein [Limnobaculum]MBK5145563.1 hypothetical protein [Limnobaculum allomyrinae]MBV7693681.1 hypothetical protein [Limnobaculum sp. M2-1]